MTIQQNYGLRPHIQFDFTSTGLVGPEVFPSNLMSNLRVAIENAAGGNEIVVFGRLEGQSTWATLATIMGSTTGTTVDISVADELKIECNTFAASGGTPRLIASGFFRRPGEPDLTTASNIGGGTGLYAGKTGNELQFKSLTAGEGITIAPSGTEIEIGATGTVTSAARLSVTFNTDAFTSVGDLVSVTGIDFVEAVTDNQDTTIPNGIFGVAFAKPTTTTVEVIFTGVIGGYGGFTPGQVLYISDTGVPSHSPPATGTLQSIGFAISSSEFFLQIGTAIRRA